MRSETCGMFVIKNMTCNAVRDVWNARHEEHVVSSETGGILVLKNITCNASLDVLNVCLS